MQSYTYNCVDDSLLLPYFKKYYVSFFFKFVPWWMTANYITLLSTSFVICLLVLVFWLPSISPTLAAGLFALLLHNYLVGDHLDGMQAKKTQTSSALGEFLDHYLDVYNGAIVFYALSVFFKPIPSMVFYVLLMINCAAFAATMMEELERKLLYFGPFGTLEGVVLLIGFFISWMIPGLREIWQKELVWGYPAYWIVILAFSFGLLFTIFDIIRRLRYVPPQFAVFILFLILLTVYFYLSELDRTRGWLIVTMYSGEYIGKVMNSYFVAEEHKYPDFVSPIIAVILTVLVLSNSTSSVFFHWLNWFLFAFITYRVVRIFTLTVYEHKDYWYWLNPKNQS